MRKSPHGSMTKKHLEGLAAEIKLIADSRARLEATKAVANAAARFCPAFDRDRFYALCLIQ